MLLLLNKDIRIDSYKPFIDNSSFFENQRVKKIIDSVKAKNYAEYLFDFLETKFQR
uniref:Uncharacterized protein n=1 Tax=Arion vulgaris TaxID=1028688 RepID=A0A0B6ZEJ9_9EUPU